MLSFSTAKNVSFLFLFLTSVVLFALTCTMQAQQVQPVQPAFEAASIRPVAGHSLDDLVKGIGTFSINSFPSNRLIIRNVTLGFLIAFAFNVNSDQVAGQPEWIDSQQYEVSAKVDGERQLSREEMLPLLRALLVQRFNLATHRESKSVSGFEMTIAKGGPKLRSSKSGQVPKAQIVPNGIEAYGFSLDAFAGVLQRPIGHPVVNGTGLSGTFDIALNYAAENDTSSSLPSIYAALQEQLGLKLIPHRTAVEVVVIDHVDRTPVEN